MTKKRFLIAIAIVMVLILSVAVFVACNENQTKSYTVKFVDGESEIKSVSVEEGKTIADADVPADLTKDGYVFEGWYVGDVAFDKSAAITADVTYSAKWTKLHTVKFVDGDETIKTATVKDGEKLKDADVPADLTASGKAFEGWFDGTTAFDKDATITADKTFAAKWVGLFNVTFKNGEETIKVAQVKDGAVIAAADIPEDLTDDNYAFIGWFVGETAYDSSAAVTSDIVVSAKFSTIYKSYFGTWHGATDDWDAISYTVVVDATSITVTIGDADAQAATDIDVDTTDGTVMFKLGDTEYMLYANYDGNLCIYESSEIKLSAELEGRVHVSSTDIVGTYTTEGGHTIVINKTFAKVDDVLGVGFYYSESSGYSWSIGSNYSSLTFDSATSSWIYKENYSSDDDNVIVPELVAIDIPAEFIGNWYGTFESFGSTSYFLVKVTADGVFAYTPGSGFAKVGVATEYKDGKLTVVGLDETITASIADGKLAYKSDAAYGADCQLEKGTVVVFENNYSVFYIAKLGADNKIDQSTFALEDPQMEAGYTFKGWLSDLDYVTEFDESATFADSAVFVGSSEKTGYVVTFKKTSSDSDPVIAVVEKTNGKLAADQIPAALTYEDGSVFVGWYTSAGVKATADLAITADTTFIAKSVKESDYEGVWVSTESGKELTLVIKNGTISVESLRDCSYTFDTTDGAIKYMVHKSTYVFEYYTVEKTPTGVRYTYKYDDVDSTNKPQVVEYEMTALKAISGVAGSYKSDNTHRFVIAENGLVTTAENSDVFMGYVTGSSKSNFTIVYKTSSSSKVTTVKGAKIDAKGNLVLGNITADAEILIKDLKGFKSYYMADEGTLYVYTNSDDTITYVFKTSSDKYAYVKAEDIKGTVAEGEIFTITYGLYNGTNKKTNTTQTYKIVNGKLTTAGAEKGEYTAEGKDALTLNGFGDATLGEKSYKYSINAKNVVVLTGETTLGVTLDSEAKTYAEVASDGFVHTYIDASNDKYTMVFDGFGGATLTYSSYVYSGTYTLGTGTVTVAKTNYSYNKTYTIEESGNVLVSTDGKKVLKAAGYVVENKVEQFNGYYVNGDENIEISVAKDKTVTILLNGVAVKRVSVNWNGTVLTFDADDYDAPKEGWTSEFTIVKDGDNVKLSHACKQSYDSIYEEFETIQKDIVFTKSTKPSAETDGLEGTYKNGSNIITLDGKGNGTYNNGTEFTFAYSGSGDTKKVSDFAAFNDGENTITITSTGLTVHFSGGSGDDVYNASFTKEAAETLDAFAGTWSGKVGQNKITVVCDGKGNIKIGDTSYTYTITDGKIVVGCYTFTKSGDAIKAVYDDGEYSFDGTLTKQA